MRRDRAGAVNHSSALLKGCPGFVGMLIAIVLIGLAPVIAQSGTDDDADVLVVGAGLAGLSAALEAARDGATVTVIDSASVFGGHAIMSGGDVTIVGTPLQLSQGIHDTPDIAFKDFMAWGKDANSDWVRYYVNNSKVEIYDWLTSVGVVFEDLREYPGNSVRRAHVTEGRGLGLVSPVYRKCLEDPKITFIWNTRAIELIQDGRRVVGLTALNLRAGSKRDFRAHAVILATGGFQSNLKMVRENWPKGLPIPEHLLAGSGINSLGSGLGLAIKAGAATFNLDHQWNYERGLPDPRYPGESRGLNAIVQGVRVNARGEEFNWAEGAGSGAAFRALLNQPGATYWMVFDEKQKETFWVSGSNWGDFETIERVILNNPDVVKKAASIEELSFKTGLPLEALKKSITRFNRGHIKLKTAPFYAAQFFPLTRKSMGGVSIDLSGRALDHENAPVLGLYVAGEASGEAGINGEAALEGTFLGPAVLIGRKAARSAVTDMYLPRTEPSPLPPTTVERRQTTFQNEACTGCHNLNGLIDQKREGYWHFEHAHRVVLERKYQCAQCHSGIGLPPNMKMHSIDRVAQVNNCKSCHIAQ